MPTTSIDPEGSTIAYERSQLSALMEQAERHLTEIADADAWLATAPMGVRCRGRDIPEEFSGPGLWPAPASAAPDRWRPAGV